MTTRNKTIPSLTFGERLGLSRKKAGLNQEQMAEKLGVSPATIAKWETDGGQPRDQFTVIEKWSDLTGIREDWLVFGYESDVRSEFTSRSSITPNDHNGFRSQGPASFPFRNRPAA